MLVAMRSWELRNSLKVFESRSIMSRTIRSDQRSPSISTEAFSGHPERRLTPCGCGMKKYHPIFPCVLQVTSRMVSGKRRHNAKNHSLSLVRQSSRRGGAVLHLHFQKLKNQQDPAIRKGRSRANRRGHDRIVLPKRDRL